MDRKPALALAAWLAVVGCSGQAPQDMKRAAAVRPNPTVDATSESKSEPETVPAESPADIAPPSPAGSAPLEAAGAADPASPPPNPSAEVASHGPPADEPPMSLKAWETDAPPGQLDQGFTRVRILYATDRQRAGDTPDDCYGSERGTGTTLTPSDCPQHGHSRAE